MTTQAINPEIQELIRILNLQAGEGEGASDEDYIKWLDYIYRRFRDIKASEEDTRMFAKAMFDSVGPNATEQGVREHVRDIFGENVLPLELWEKYPNIDLDIARVKVNQNPSEAEQLIRKSIDTKYAEDYVAGLRVEDDIEKDINAYMQQIRQDVRTTQVPGVGEKPQAPVPGGYGDYGELFGEKGDLQIDLPDMLDPKYAEKISHYESGKNKQNQYIKDNHDVYGAFGAVQKRIYDNEESALRTMYDVMRAIGMYNSPYVNFLDDYLNGKQRIWGEEDWKVVMNSISAMPEFNSIMIDSQDKIQKAIDSAYNNPNIPIRDNLNLQASLISDINEPTEWIVQKEKQGLEAWQLQFGEDNIRKDINTFIMQNLGPDLASGTPGSSAVAGRKLFKEWQDRGFNWMKDKSDVQLEQEKMMKQQGFKI